MGRQYIYLILILVALFSLHRYLDGRGESSIRPESGRSQGSPLQFEVPKNLTPNGHILVGKKISINTDDPKILEALPGIGPSTAKKIIAYRKRYGDFKSEQDLKNVSGLGEKKLERILSLITVQP